MMPCTDGVPHGDAPGPRPVPHHILATSIHAGGPPQRLGCLDTQEHLYTEKMLDVRRTIWCQVRWPLIVFLVCPFDPAPDATYSKDLSDLIVKSKEIRIGHRNGRVMLLQDDCVWDYLGHYHTLGQGVEPILMMILGNRLASLLPDRRPLSTKTQWQAYRLEGLKGQTKVTELGMRNQGQGHGILAFADTPSIDFASNIGKVAV